LVHAQTPVDRRLTVAYGQWLVGLPAAIEKLRGALRAEADKTVAQADLRGVR
jgi:hypothetical protein